ncbi:MAG: crossover junction endodeoxyribonuclease RuvC, partial [Actinomycetes bacterium]
MRVLGVDPGLTRCGVGVVDGGAGRALELVDVGVITTDTALPLEQRLLIVSNELTEWIDRHHPDAIAVERVFSQH